MNCKDIKSLSSETMSSQTRNIIFSVVYRPLDGKLMVYEIFFKKILSDSATVINFFFLVGDFNINLLDLETNNKVQSFVNLMFEFSLIPTINKGTTVTKHIVAVIEIFITICILNNRFKYAIS